MPDATMVGYPAIWCLVDDAASRIPIFYERLPSVLRRIRIPVHMNWLFAHAHHHHHPKRVGR